MTARVTAAYGSWPSPISAADVARAQRRLSFPTSYGDDVWWQETRPDEGGRTTIIHRRPDGATEELLPAPWDARSRVHEYGGRSYLPIPLDGGYGIVFANYEDQRLHRFDPSDSKPRPLTPEAAVPAGLRYVDFVLSPDGTEVWCVCEGHVLAPQPANGAAPAGGAAAGAGGAEARPGGAPVKPISPANQIKPAGPAEPVKEVRRAIVAVPLDGSAADNPAAIRELISGASFYASPTPSPDGGHIAWVQWNHPRMPWDGTEVRVANLENGKVERARTVKGGLSESALAPAWLDERSLYVISDWSGWWNIYQVGLYGGSPAAQYPAEEEFAGPLWQLGGMPYVMLSDGRLAVLHGQGDRRLGIYDPETAELTDLDLPYADWQLALSGDGQSIVGIAGGPTSPACLVRVEAPAPSAGEGTAKAQCVELRRELDELPDVAYLPIPRAETLEGPFGRPVHAYVFPPTNPAAQAPDGELPPYVVFVHGGPTAHVSSVLKLERAYFTSRGIGVIDVNYGGSTGYGRSYRERLRKQWGLVDVEDAVAAAQALAAAGEADPDRLAIRGGSAGGWTTLAAITATSVFKAATSYYGVSDLKAFVEETHDFESQYLFGLIGPLPGFERAYEERSPLRHADRTTCPVLLLHGLDDPIVLPVQSEKFADALAGREMPYAYLTFEGESHGFRRADTMVTCLESELSFYGQTLGFDPPDVRKIELVVGKRPTPAAPPLPPA